MNRGQLIATTIGIAATAGLVLSAASRSGNQSEPPSLPEQDVGAAATPIEAAEPIELEAPENLGPAGTLTNLDGWLQTEATSFEDFDGRVRIVQFWTFSCYNCKNTIPHLQTIYDTYQPDGLEIIGVHAPEFDFERDYDSIAEAAVEHGVTWPIAIDNNKTNFRRWQPERRFWPRTFVLDANGDIRYDHIGEGAYDELEATVAYLMANGGA